MIRSARLLWGNADGAVAPIVALSLTALIAGGGIAFDYARMASMDTELQTAADQAALAAATQLDGNDGACSRAAAAAANMVSHSTLMSNDGQGLHINVQDESTCDATGKIRFWQDVNKTQAATDDSNAKFVEVEVDPRTANFQLTPIVAAFSSGQMKAIAFAGVNSAICKVPPVMMCNPAETTDPDFTIADYVGDGIRLIANDGGGSYGPGDFGFLETNAGSGASVLGQELGRTNVPGDCVQGDGVTTDPGNMISVRDALNTRFGMYTSVNSACGNTGSLCPPSANIRQDLLLRGNGAAFSQLGFVTSINGNQKGWLEAPNPYPGSANITTTGTNYHALSGTEITSIAPMGYPEDMCHAFKSDGTGACRGGLIGNGSWDRYAYFKSNSASYGTALGSASSATDPAFTSFLNSTFGTPAPTRYKVYQYEMAHAATRLLSQTSGTMAAQPNPANMAGEPGSITPSETNVDRRVLSVAVINCNAAGLNGKVSDVKVQKWIDVFLVQPSEPRTVGVRTANSDVYVEVIGATANAGNSGEVQLIKKSVPYLIE